MVFVGTKRQAQETVHDEAIRCGMPYVTERWLGGMFTNWQTMHQRIVELERMEKLFATGDIEKLTKKEALAHPARNNTPEHSSFRRTQHGTPSGPRVRGGR